MQNITCLNPTYTKKVNVVNRYYYIDQEHICENQTVYVNHYIKRNKYIPKYTCLQKNVYCEQNMPNSNINS